MHTEKPKRAILRAYQKYNKNLDREIMKGCKKIVNTSVNKPNAGKTNKYVNLMNDFASDILK